MNLEARKLEFIRAFLLLKSEDAISRLEDLLKIESRDKVPFTQEELNDRINRSLIDSKQNNITQTQDLLREIDEWE